MKLAVAITFACLVLARHAVGQQSGAVVNRTAPISAAAEKTQTVNVTFQLTMPAPEVSSPEDMTKAMAATTQSLYDIVNHECDVLTAVLKGTCRLGKLSINGNLNGPNAPPALGNRANFVNVNATATFEFEAAPAVPPN